MKRSRVRFLGLEPVLGVYGGDLKNASIVGIEPVTSRSLGIETSNLQFTINILTDVINNEVYKCFESGSKFFFRIGDLDENLVKIVKRNNLTEFHQHLVINIVC